MKEYLTWNDFWMSRNNTNTSLTSKIVRDSYFFSNQESEDEEYYKYLMSKKEMEKTDKNHEGNHE